MKTKFTQRLALLALISTISCASTSKGTSLTEWRSLDTHEKMVAFDQASGEQKDLLWSATSLLDKGYIATIYAIAYIKQSADSSPRHPDFPYDYRPLYHSTLNLLTQLITEESTMIDHKVYSNSDRRCAGDTGAFVKFEWHESKTSTGGWVASETRWDNGVLISAEVGICEKMNDGRKVLDFVKTIIHEIAHAAKIDHHNLLTYHDDPIRSSLDKIECAATLFSYLALYNAGVRKKIKFSSHKDRCPSIHKSFRMLRTGNNSQHQKEIEDFEREQRLRH